MIISSRYVMPAVVGLCCLALYNFVPFSFRGANPATNRAFFSSTWICHTE
uniref:Uncharacterized protein n=1 Tax=Arundo donax TaxID=35708 RepID=A0A0A8YUC7_ARUDO